MNTLDLSGLSQGSELTGTRECVGGVEDQCVDGVEGKSKCVCVCGRCGG